MSSLLQSLLPPHLSHKRVLKKTNKQFKSEILQPVCIKAPATISLRG